jgi:hypothetical protein
LIITKAELEHYNSELATSRLVTYCYELRCKGKRPTPEKLHALCMLTWFPSFKRAILPALWRLWDRPGDPPKIDTTLGLKEYGFENGLIRLTAHGTGFVNYYRAYRNSSLRWIRKNYKTVSSITKMAAKLRTDDQARQIVEVIESLPKVGKPVSKTGMGSASSLLTPLVACLDPRHRFPILNKASHVTRLQHKLKVFNRSLTGQFDALVGLIGRFNMANALMIDACSNRLATLKDLRDAAVFVARLRASNKPINSKDDSGYEIPPRKYVSEGKRLHNKMTNGLTAICTQKGYTVMEGREPFNYDALIQSTSGRGRTVLVEAKSSVARSHLRLAVGQLLDYRRGFSNGRPPALAVLLPGAPSADDAVFAKSVSIDIFWFSDKACKNISGTRQLWTLLKAR